MYAATGYSAAVTDAGPLKVVVTATYTFNRPQYSYGAVIINTAGAGHYTAVITLYANSKSILIDEDSDMQFAYYLPMYAQLTPDIARWRGHDSLSGAGVSDSMCGYESADAVSGATNATPIVVSAPSSLSNGQPVLIASVGGNTAANGKFYAKTTSYSAGQFALYSDANLTVPIAGTGNFTSGGVVKPAYRGQTLYPTPDAYLDLTYSGDRPASYTCSGTDLSGPTYKKLLTDYPAAAHSSGWYSILYNSTGNSASPVVGFYTGRASQQVRSAPGPSMPGIYTSNSHWITSSQDAGIQIDNLLRGPDATLAPLVHRNWAIWVSTKADLLAPAAHQPIADDQNSLTGINLSRLYTYQLAFPDPATGWNWQYLTSAAASQLVGWVRDGTSKCGSTTCYYTLLYNSETSTWGRGLLDMWKGNSSAAVQTMLNAATTFGQRMVNNFTSGDNHFDAALHYYQLGLTTSPATAVLNAILMDSNSTVAQKRTAKACLALFGSVFWDNDWFPIDNASGESVGLANQIQQYLQYRAQSAAVIPSNPFLATKLAQGKASVLSDLATEFSATGAAGASTHYQGTYFQPLYLNYQNLSLIGEETFAGSRWIPYAQWELSIQTPPEPRFGNLRKGYSNGDGNTEADVRTGMLATGINSVNPTLAGNLIWAWNQSNRAAMLTEDMQFVTTIPTIDVTITPVTPTLGSINIPGYHTAERHSFGTANETALWFINGGFYATGGHRHYDDGQVSIYAHAAPLAIDWNANLYSPDTPGRFMHDSIVYDSERIPAWSDDNPSPDEVSTLFSSPTNTEYEGFTRSTHSTATFTKADSTIWTRNVRMMAFNASYPIIYVADSFSGTSAAAAKTLTWNLMATGAVTTPSGSVTPTARFSTGCQSPAGALPSNGTIYNLGSGLQPFSFTGYTWAQHATGGINWDLLTLSAVTSQQFLIGDWGHGCHSGRETGEYSTANSASFAEKQHILRVHDTGPFTTIILPYRKTETPTRTITSETCGTQIVQGSETTCFDGAHATWTDQTNSNLSVYDNSTQTAFGTTAVGGPQEVTITPSQIVWTISGAASGDRSLTLTGTWTPTPSVPKVGGTYTYTFAGGLQAAPVTITFN
jgi:hypothetical protein